MKKPQIFVQDLCVDHWQLFDYRGKGQAEKWLASIPAEARKLLFFQRYIIKQYPFLQNQLNVMLIETEQEAMDLDCQTVILSLWMCLLRESLLQKTIQSKQPARIYAHFYHEQDHFFSTMPTRDHFKWFYAFLMKKGPLDVNKYGDDLAKYRGWSRETIDFISKVFFELDFVTIENGLISLKTNAKKRDLADSLAYQRKKEQFELEKELVYSSYQQLNDWFNQQLVQEARDLEEEIKQWI